METDEKPEEQMDCIDTALNAVIEDCLTDVESEEDFNTAADILMDVFAHLVDEEEVEDPPEDDATEESKQEWITKNMPKVKEAMKEALDVNSDME